MAFSTRLLDMISNSAEEISWAPALSKLNYARLLHLESLLHTSSLMKYEMKGSTHLSTVVFKALYRHATGDSVDDRKVTQLSRLALAKQIMIILSSKPEP
ncbi:hypothetical protein BDN70DRAFT_884374 [Pholiota conissans]|uniref:Uncharacterized protein n=1 Tax=Pholiota conissans TaxID=109636 RepID=A0A9P6CW49_9AGAR|nr:hypothetical protein BDN70DRAFT_884374 [Pholiota conissans]